MADAQYGAFLGPKVRDTFQILDRPAKVVMGDINPDYNGIMFPGSQPKMPDLSFLVMDSSIPQDVRERILLAVEP